VGSTAALIALLVGVVGLVRRKRAKTQNAIVDAVPSEVDLAGIVGTEICPAIPVREIGIGDVREMHATDVYPTELSTRERRDELY
jgi:hypothetical protein